MLLRTCIQVTFTTYTQQSTIYFIFLQVLSPQASLSNRSSSSKKSQKFAVFFLLFFLQVLEPSPLELTTGAAKKSKVRGTLLFSLPVSKRPPGPSPVGFFYFTSDFRCFFSPFYLVVSDWTCLYLYFTQYFQIRPTFTFFAVLQNFYSILYASILSCMHANFSPSQIL